MNIQTPLFPTKASNNLLGAFVGFILVNNLVAAKNKKNAILKHPNFFTKLLTFFKILMKFLDGNDDTTN